MSNRNIKYLSRPPFVDNNIMIMSWEGDKVSSSATADVKIRVPLEDSTLYSLFPSSRFFLH